MTHATRIVPALAAALLAGCSSGNYPVTGQVTYTDGSPVVEGTVVGEATLETGPISAQGSIAQDGRFTLGSDRAGGGLPPGTYRFAVLPVPIPDGKAGEGKVPSVSGKFTRLDSSGITLEVKPEPNVLNITVERPGAKPTRRGG